MTFTKPSRQLRQQAFHQSLEIKWPDKANMPTMYDLPSEDPEEPGLPDEFHDYQPDLLSATFKLTGYSPDNIFSAADLNLYYDPDHNWYKRPDWFGVLGKPAGCNSDELRMSYVVWQEERKPFIVVELLSPGTEKEDFGKTVSSPGRPPTKWTVYEQILQIPYYVIYDRYSGTLSGFRWVKGAYQPMPIGADNKIWLPEANAGIGLWQGRYKRFTESWLRWYDDSGWIPTPTEQAQRETEKAQRETERAQLETERAQLLAQQAQLEAQQAQLLAQQAQLKRKKAQTENELLRAKLQSLGVDMTSLGLSPDSSRNPSSNGTNGQEPS